jgi:predicted nucleotidyltransferase
MTVRLRRAGLLNFGDPCNFCYRRSVISAEILDVWRCSEHELRAKGVRHVGLFGSTARDDVVPDIDIDIMIDLDPDLPLSVDAYVGIKLFIEDLLKVQSMRWIAIV